MSFPPSVQWGRANQSVARTCVRVFIGSFLEFVHLDSEEQSILGNHPCVWGTEIYEVIVQSFTATMWKAPAALKDPPNLVPEPPSSNMSLASSFCENHEQPSLLTERQALPSLFAATLTMFSWSCILIATNLICFHFVCGSCTLAEICKSWQVFFYIRVWGRGGRRAGGKTTITWTCARECKQYLLWKPSCNVRSPFYYMKLLF